MMNRLNITVAENGFVVYEDAGQGHALSKCWAFESSETLAGFIKKWGDDVNSQKLKSDIKNDVGGILPEYD